MSDGPGAPEKPDAVEVWATRTGRFLGYAALLGLALFLLLIYGPR